MAKRKTKNTGSPLWFWTGTLVLALIVFVSSTSIVSFVERYSKISEWPILGMLVTEVPLILFGVYCLKKGKGNAYSLKADLLPVLIVSSLFGLLRLMTPGIYYWVGSGVPVLAFVFLPIYLLHRRALRKMGVANIPRGERNRKIIELQCSYNEAFSLCISALSSVEGRARISEIDKSSGSIVAKTGPNMKGWGEVITFDVREVNDGVEIEVRSEPRIRPQLLVLDYGKNYENVERIADFLKSERVKSGM